MYHQVIFLGQKSGVFHQSLGFNNTILRESGGDPVKGRAQKIALVTDIKSGCNKKNLITMEQGAKPKA